MLLGDGNSSADIIKNSYRGVLGAYNCILLAPSRCDVVALYHVRHHRLYEISDDLYRSGAGGCINCVNNLNAFFSVTN